MILEAADNATLALERIQQAIRHYPWASTLGISQGLTCSIGAIAKPAEWHWQPSLKLADQALYRIKQQGRDAYLLLLPRLPVSGLDAVVDMQEMLDDGRLMASSDNAMLASIADIER